MITAVSPNVGFVFFTELSTLSFGATQIALNVDAKVACFSKFSPSLH